MFEHSFSKRPDLHYRFRYHELGFNFLSMLIFSKSEQYNSFNKIK
jgi:hypothetical protein